MVLNAQPITTQQAANLLDCGPENVRKLARAQQLTVIAIVGRGQRLFDRSEVEALAERRRRLAELRIVEAP